MIRVLLAAIMALALVTPVFADTVKVVIKTNKGDITVDLEAEKAPKSVANFLAYVDSGFYNGTIFHRVIPNFMIQGGGLTADMSKKPTLDPIENEAKNGLKNDRGTLAMARTNAPHSATAQFFINHKNNDFLNNSPRGWGYAVFGKVSAGMDVVDAIAATPTGVVAGRGDVPKEVITIESIQRTE